MDIPYKVKSVMLLSAVACVFPWCAIAPKDYCGEVKLLYFPELEKFVAEIFNAYIPLWGGVIYPFLKIYEIESLV